VAAAVQAEEEWLRFISNLTRVCPEEIVSLNGVELIIDTARKSEKHFKLCIQPLEEMAGVPEGATEIEKVSHVNFLSSNQAIKRSSKPPSRL
jgi:hypothetical protein